MQDWLKMIHGGHSAYPAQEVAIKLAVTLGLGLLVGFEREWSQKDIGVRTFTMAALLGLLGEMLNSEALLLAGATVLALIVFANLRSLQVSGKLEATTSAALAIIFLLGVFVGQGHLFTPVACCIVVAMLLSLKPQLHAFAGGLNPQEVRGAIVLALLGFVIWPLLPNYFVDPWHLVEPRAAWVIIITIACLGFVNYLLLRIYGSKGLYVTAVLGGLVNSTATAAELATTLTSSQQETLIVPLVLLTSVAMFLRNTLILAIFAHSAIRTAALPLAAMSGVAAIWAFRERRKAQRTEGSLTITLTSPVSLGKVLRFGLLFLLVEIFATIALRMLGGAGLQIVSFLGGLVSSASTTAAAATLTMHGRVAAAQAGVATVITSMASAVADLPIVQRQLKNSAINRRLSVSTALQLLAGITVLILQTKLHRIF